MHIRKRECRYTLALLLGVMMSLAMPPFNLVVFVFISFSVLYCLLSKANNVKEAILLSWWFGFSYFSSGLYWLAYPLMIDITLFGWLIPFAVLGLPFFMAMFFSFAGVIVYALPYKGLLGAIVFSLSFTLAQWLLGHYFFNGFPWNLFSYAWSFSIEMLQITSIIGSYGLVFFTIFCGVGVGVYLCDNDKISISIATILLCSNFVYGVLRLSNAQIENDQKVKLRLVQANMKDLYQSKYRNYTGREIINQYLRLTKSPGFEDITHVIWPESAVPFTIGINKGLPNLMIINKFLIFGGDRIMDNRVYNSLFVADYQGKIVDFYDKYHLVPFGEFIPLYNIFKYILSNSILGHSYSGAEKMKTISLFNTPIFAPLICYEAIFPGEVVNNEGGAKWMINITNDAWFGVSSEPYQHFAMSRVRSIEEGIPLIRVASTGISAVVDSYGRVIKSLPIMTEGIIDSELPRSLVKPTLYSQYFRNSNIILYIIMILSLLILYRMFKILCNTKFIRNNRIFL